MQMIGQKKSTILELVIFWGLSICVVVASEVIGLKQRWEDGVVYTVVLFAAIGTALRPAWGRKSSWTRLALIFAGHTIVLLAALQALPPRRTPGVWGGILPILELMPHPGFAISDKPRLRLNECSAFAPPRIHRRATNLPASAARQPSIQARTRT